MPYHYLSERASLHTWYLLNLEIEVLRYSLEIEISNRSKTASWQEKGMNA